MLVSPNTTTEGGGPHILLFYLCLPPSSRSPKRKGFFTAIFMPCNLTYCCPTVKNQFHCIFNVEHNGKGALKFHGLGASHKWEQSAFSISNLKLILSTGFRISPTSSIETRTLIARVDRKISELQNKYFTTLCVHTFCFEFVTTTT